MEGSCMEEQLEMESKGLEGTPAEDENRKQTRRPSLQFGFMILQWIVLLICLVLVGLCYFKSPGPQTQWIFIKNSNQSIICKKAIGIKKKDGTMDVNDLKCSIPIHCDGFYLVFLEGIIRLKGAKDSLMLGVYHQPGEKFLTITSHGQKTEVKEVIVHEFRSEDEIFLKYNDSNYDTSKQDLTLSLIMLTPPSYCYSKM
ncbi:tumor necrosis factor ligand superfamily member 4-like [Anolis sagrei]|uniref:tumor necrosis factor ligand superfamily member 4-like n=1 Tax=Anolis sagrei TaxID=38937 RepID=UPI0035207B09